MKRLVEGDDWTQGVMRPEVFDHYLAEAKR
jgi:hypothetical protein